MKASKTIKNKYGSEIEIAQCKNGGNSSWGEKSGDAEDSIRLGWYNEEGRFDPISSAELPLWGLKDIIQKAAEYDMFSKSDLSEIIGSLTASIYRQV